MPTNRERVVAYLQDHPEGANDDQLSSELNIVPRQTVDRICRELYSVGLLSRRVEGVDEKIVNRWIGPPMTTAPSAPLTTSAETPRQPKDSSRESGLARLTVAVIALQSDEDLRGFAYNGDTAISENTVKDVMKAALEAQGWRVTKAEDRNRNIVLDATRKQERLVIEAKGEGGYHQMRGNYFHEALGALLQRMEHGEPSYGMALPANRNFAGLIARLPVWVRRQLQLHFYVVRPAGPDRFEVGHLAPPTPEA